MSYDILNRAEQRHLSAYLKACEAVRKLPRFEAARIRDRVYRVRIGTMHHDLKHLQQEMKDLVNEIGKCKQARYEVLCFIRETKRYIVVLQGSELDAFLAEIMEP